jgi:hypothetical protein
VLRKIFLAHKGTSVSFSGSNLKEVLDKLRLAHHVISVQSFDLTLPHHIHGLNPFERALNSI